MPRAVYESLANILTADAIDVFSKSTRDPLIYDHGFDTWKGISHGAYSKRVGQLLKQWYHANGNKPIGKANAECIVRWIESGKIGNRRFAIAAANTFEDIATWRLGFLQSISVAEAARQANPRLEAKSLKSIARVMVNQDASIQLSPAAKAVYKRLGRRAVKTAAAKIIPAVMIYTILSATARGATGRGRVESGGAFGAVCEVSAELVFADIVEGLVFPQIVAATDTVEDIFSLRIGPRCIGRKRFGDLYGEYRLERGH